MASSTLARGKPPSSSVDTARPGRLPWTLPRSTLLHLVFRPPTLHSSLRCSVLERALLPRRTPRPLKHFSPWLMITSTTAPTSTRRPALESARLEMPLPPTLRPPQRRCMRVFDCPLEKRTLSMPTPSASMTCRSLLRIRTLISLYSQQRRHWAALRRSTGRLRGCRSMVTVATTAEEVRLGKRRNLHSYRSQRVSSYPRQLLLCLPRSKPSVRTGPAARLGWLQRIMRL